MVVLLVLCRCFFLCFSLYRGAIVLIAEVVLFAEVDHFLPVLKADSDGVFPAFEP
jgi:hypothetical protein